MITCNKVPRDQTTQREGGKTTTERSTKRKEVSSENSASSLEGLNWLYGDIGALAQKYRNSLEVNYLLQGFDFNNTGANTTLF